MGLLKYPTPCSTKKGRFTQTATTQSLGFTINFSLTDSAELHS
ncbi:hypothetical protein [Flavobacterium sp.]